MKNEPHARLGPSDGIPSVEWQHVLEDGSLDHEWVTEGGVTFCKQCEQERDWNE